MSSILQRVKSSRRRDWGLAALLLAALGAQYWLRYYGPWGRIPAPEGREGVDWFLLVRVPELPNDEVGQAGIQRRLEDWLVSLRQAGFKPMYLTDALEPGRKLPEKAVVLVFTQSYRKSIEELQPLLKKHRWPALWLTDQDLLDQSDHRLVSRHHRGQMRASRRWDLGHYRTSTKTFVLETGEGNVKLAWTGYAGNSALNRRADAPQLSYLSVGLAWTGRQLVERLYAEVPLSGRTPLTASRFFSQTFGLPVYDPTAERMTRFNLIAPHSARSAWIDWRGAAGMRDLELELDVGMLVGELWVSFRSEGEAGHSVRVGFTEDRIVVDRSEWGRETRVGSIFWAPRLRRNLQAVITLRGDKLRLSVNDGPARPAAIVRELSIGAVPAARHGILELLVYGKVRGAAQARSVALTATPLTSEPLKGVTGR